MVNRRSLLAQAAWTAGAALLPSAWSAAAAPLRLNENPFQLGVASGDPWPDSVVLWTRLAPRPLEPAGGMAPGAVTVRWEVAEDDAFRRVVRRGAARAAPEAGHSVHVEADGLRPGRTYWYRFMAGGQVSETGRTRTIPAPGEDVRRLRIAYGSCQKYEAGYYGAYAHMVRDEPDLILFLGDYIYEQPATKNGVRRHPDAEAADLATYRLRYAQYKSDPDLRAAHAAAPWMTIWDDHEVVNDYAGDQMRAALDPATFLKRRAAAYQAYYEHMPLRRRAVPVGPDMQLYRSLDIGRLAQIQLLDTRQHRPHRTCDAVSQGKRIPDCDERRDPARSILGQAQERWLMETLGGSRARWNLLGQQYLMGEFKLEDGRFSNDGWDGYAAGRDRLLRAWRDRKVANPIVLGGDMHVFVAGDLALETGAKPIATEFLAGSISSLGALNSELVGPKTRNPHLKFMDGETRGYGLLDIAADRCEVRFRGLESALVPHSPIRDLARFVVEDGEAGVKAA
jgi:alkaline phosphatase D